MKIAVCLKVVPSRESRYQLNASATWIDESQVSFQASECDEYALEEALKLKERHGGEVVILSIGPTQSEKVIRKGLAMGADRAVLIQDEERRVSDPLLAARLLAEIGAQEGFDLILTGTQSDDYGWGQTGV
ncbi:MAG TPA: electron transfer flavoprotein subunit beta, partial [Acidobacteriota bacterium]|nr:electron transfer flavoprotein subunit beta [Acidobacteriota bacterium]